MPFSPPQGYGPGPDLNNIAEIGLTTQATPPTGLGVLSFDGTDVRMGNGSAAVSVGNNATGTWTPAAGTFNVAAGAVINVATIPNGATSFFAEAISGTVATNSIRGVTTGSGSVWVTSQGVSASSAVYAGAADAISSISATGSLSGGWYDGSYTANGYFQCNSGFLQFVAAAAGTASTDTGNVIRWGVS